MRFADKVIFAITMKGGTYIAWIYELNVPVPATRKLPWNLGENMSFHGQVDAGYSCALFGCRGRLT